MKSCVESGKPMIKGCTLKIRFFSLVVNTADFINERASPTLGFSHAILGPMAIFTTYIFLGIFMLGSIKNKHPSRFLEIYALLTCISVEISLSIAVFGELQKMSATQAHAALILDGVLPIFIGSLLICDLIIVLFSLRQQLTPVASNITFQQEPQEMLEQMH